MSSTYWRLEEENWDSDIVVKVFRTKPTVHEVVRTIEINYDDATVLVNQGFFIIPYTYYYSLREEEFDN